MTQLSKWDTNHRPWPVPSSPWIMRQSWNDLLFIHYPIAIEQLKKIVPHQIPIDTFDGMGWISIVPFKMNNVGIRGIPFSLQFPELNIRTYVTVDNKPGVYFFSLDATNLPVVFFCNALFNIPYIHSSMNIYSKLSTETMFSCERKKTDKGDISVQFSCRYKAISAPFHTQKGTLDHWLTERYCFYTINKLGHIKRCEISHEQWPIQHAEVDIIHNSLPIMNDVDKLEQPPLIHYSTGLDVRIWPFIRI